MIIDTKNLVRVARQAADLTTTEAAQLVHVGRRTFEMWESGERNIPAAKLELFMSKLDGARPKERELVVVLGEQQAPLDVVAGDTFAGIVKHNDGTATISSLAIDRATGRPYVYRTTFKLEHNSHVIRKTENWKNVMDV